MATFVPPSDLGVILYATHDGSGTYTNPRGNAGTPRTLTHANWIASEWFYPGHCKELAIVISGVISAGMASALVAVERQALEPRNDAAPPTFFKPSIVSTTRTDAMATAAALQTILRAELLRGAGAGVDQVAAWSSETALAAAAAEVLDVTLRMTDHRLGGRCRVIVRASNAPQAGDKIVVAAFAASL